MTDLEIAAIHEWEQARDHCLKAASYMEHGGHREMAIVSRQLAEEMAENVAVFVSEGVAPSLFPVL